MPMYRFGKCASSRPAISGESVKQCTCIGWSFGTSSMRMRSVSSSASRVWMVSGLRRRTACRSWRANTACWASRGEFS
jgi:hypothetical protein